MSLPLPAASMLYPNLSININKKRQGLEDGGAQLINTPVILDRILDLEEQKNNNSFAFSHLHQPSLNALRNEDNKSISLQTPILDFNQTPFFNQTSSASAITPSDELNNFVAPNEILQTYTTASSTSTSTTTNVNLNNSTHASLHQPEYQFTITSAGFNNAAQQQAVGNQYASSAIILNHQQPNDLATAINHHQHHHSQGTDPSAMTYTELKPSNQQQTALMIPNSVYDISSYKKNPPPYPSPASPASSMSSQTSSSNLDHQDSMYPAGAYGESSTSHLNRSQRRFASAGQSSSESKKGRLTKKQKYDAMLTEERQLTNNNNQLRADISNLEQLIKKYKNSIMNTVKSQK